jgi:hypothetical protein
MLRAVLSQELLAVKKVLEGEASKGLFSRAETVALMTPISK